MSEPFSNLKAKADCECGLDSCTLFGTLGRPDRNGMRHVRGCGCNVCRGRRNKRKGGRKQAKAVQSLGIPRSTIHPGHEEFLPGSIRVEVKAGAQVKPIHTRFLSAHAQSEASRSFGDHRPFAFVAMPDGVKHGYVIVRTDHLVDFVAAAAEQLEMIP